jgi:pilus assembly protein CpaB
VNPRQRRGLLLLAISGLGLIAVFVLVAGYVAEVREEVDPKVRLLALAKPAEPYQAISDDMVKQVEMPERWAPPSALRDPGQLVGVVAAAPLSKDSLLQEDMLIPPPQLAPGERELAILVDAETGVAGKIGPNSVVDIVATYPGNERKAAESRVVVPNARIVEVGAPRVDGGSGVREQGANPKQVVPVTFALTPEQVLVVSYAETNAAEVRLALLRPGEQSELSSKQRAYSREPDPEPAQ